MLPPYFILLAYYYEDFPKGWILIQFDFACYPWRIALIRANKVFLMQHSA